MSHCTSSNPSAKLIFPLFSLARPPDGSSSGRFVMPAKVCPDRSATSRRDVSKTPTQRT
jgi:hypothetical protein